MNTELAAAAVPEGLADIVTVVLAIGVQRIPVEISLGPFEFEEEFRIGAIIRDVTDRVKAEEQIRALLRATPPRPPYLEAIKHELKTNLENL